MYRHVVLIFSLISLIIAPQHAKAQTSFNNVAYATLPSLNSITSQPYVPVTGTLNASADLLPVGIPNQFGSYVGAAVPLNAFASQQDLLATNQGLGQTSQNVTALQTGLALNNQNLASLSQNIQALTQADAMLNSAILQNTQAITKLDQAVRRAQSRSNQGVAAVSSLTVVPPNPGDRFSVSFGGGEYGSQGGGGISFAYRPPEAANMMVFGGYSRTLDTNLFKGGIAFSFH
ncbi:MAG: hypothetical protein JO001_10285 [Alphaproteobacteria bacterium]|nr:hypothetical protein [Alphaproteobacteria bacterium]